MHEDIHRTLDSSPGCKQARLEESNSPHVTDCISPANILELRRNWKSKPQIYREI